MRITPSANAPTYKPNAATDANGRVINPGEHFMVDGCKYLVDSVDRNTNEVVSMGRRFNCKDGVVVR